MEPLEKKAMGQLLDEVNGAREYLKEAQEDNVGIKAEILEESLDSILDWVNAIIG